MPSTDDTAPELSRQDVLDALCALIDGATVVGLPDPNRLDVEIFDVPDGARVLVTARFRNAAGENRRQQFLLQLLEITETDYDFDSAEPLD